MADRRRSSVALLQPHSEVHHSNGAFTDSLRNLTASAQLLPTADLARPAQGTEGWQEEAWNFYESLGEFNFGVEWFAKAMSRVRLTAAKVVPGGDEPEVLEDGPAAELVSKLVNGTDGQAQMLQSFGVHLSVPGDCYLVGREVTDEDVETGVLLDAEPDEFGRVWTVQPVHTLRPSRSLLSKILLPFGGSQRPVRGWDIQTEDARWTPLPDESLVCRVWNRNERFPWRATSAARPALPIMREIDMYNRQIIASLVSRIALNGILLIPDEVTFPSSPQYANAVDPFMAELIDIMRAAIKNPGSPASAAPVPVKIPAEFIDKIKHLSFATPLDEKLFQSRDQALNRLATTLDLPAEIMTGLGEPNHWSAWKIGEDAIKIHIAPKVETVVRCLTIGYLHPMLRALNSPVRLKSGERLIVWYDTSELTQRPDRSDAALKLSDSLVISDTATRRETGFDEADAPTNDELITMILRRLAVQPSPQLAFPALEELTGTKLEAPAPPAPPQAPVAGAFPDASGPVGDSDTSRDDVSATGPPTTQNAEEPAETVAAAASVRRSALASDVGR